MNISQAMSRLRMYFPRDEWTAQITSEATDALWRNGKVGIRFFAHVWRPGEENSSFYGDSEQTLALAVAKCIVKRKIVVQKIEVPAAVNEFAADAEKVAGAS